MNLLKRLTLKNLELNKKRTIVTIIGITLSVALVAALASIYTSFISSMISFEKKEQGNYHVLFENVPVSEIKTFENNREIEKIFITENLGYAYLPDSKNASKPYLFLSAFTKESLNNLSVNLIEGRLPENENEIVIPSHLKTNGRVFLKIGDSLTLDIGTRVDLEGNVLSQNDQYVQDDYSETIIDASTEEVIKESFNEAREEKIIDTTEHTFKIVGIIERPSYNIEPYSAPGYTIITYKENVDEGIFNVFARYTKEGLKEKDALTAHLIGIDSNIWKEYQAKQNHTEEELERFENELAKAKYNIKENNYLVILETNPLKDGGAITGLSNVVIIVCIIIVFTSVFCIKNSFDISLTEKIKQYGMLRSVGATKKQIRKNVFFEATILGLIGIPLGILFGFLASYILIIISNYFLQETIALNIIFSFSWFAVLIAILLGVVTIYLSAFRSAHRASKITPLESIRNSANIKIQKKKVKGSKLVRHFFGIGGDLAYKNLQRNKKKYRTTVISIIVSVAIFIGLFSFIDLAFTATDALVNQADYNIFISSSTDVRSKFLELVKDENVSDYIIDQVVWVNFEKAPLSKKYIQALDLDKDSEDIGMQIVSIDKEHYRKLVESLSLNYDLVKDEAILYVPLKTAREVSLENGKTKEYIGEKLAYKKKDKISGSLTDDSIIDITLAEVTDKNILLWKTNEELLIVNEDFFQNKIFDNTLESSPLECYIQAVDPDKVQTDAELLLKDDNYYLNNTFEQSRMMNNLFILISIFLYGFIIVISLIGITNIFNTITTSIELRRQEFAMLKSIGMTKKELKILIRLESIFLGGKALLFGLPLGILLSFFVYQAFEGEIFYRFPLLAVVLSILAVFLLITCIMRYAIRKIDKQNTIETIRNENI